MRKIEIIYFIRKKQTTNVSKFIVTKSHKLLNLRKKAVFPYIWPKLHSGSFLGPTLPLYFQSISFISSQRIHVVKLTAMLKKCPNYGTL